jgi:hypothetical protein
VPINEISKAHFDSLVKTVKSAEHNVSEERAWFATSREGVIGTVIYDIGGKSWAYVVLVREEDGRFQWADGDFGRSQEHAISQLKDAMGRREAASLPATPEHQPSSD